MTPTAQRAVRISAGSVLVEARLNDSRAAGAIWDALPIEAKAETWGDEIYFDIGLDLAAEAPSAVVEVGDLGYWPPGRAFCIFFVPSGPDEHARAHRTGVIRRAMSR